jgi:pyruvate dehydrogenase E2 component (dihydrolipoamide acetyltransferase)
VQAYAAALKSGGAPVSAVAAPAAVAAPVAVPVVAQSAASSAFVPAEGTVNASPQARKLALENNLDVTKIKGTGNFGRVMPDDVLIAAGKKSAVVAATPVLHASVAAAPVAAAPAAVKAAPAAPKEAAITEGVVAMDGMQKAVAKNMEKTLTVPIFRVSRYIQLNTVYCRSSGHFNQAFSFNSHVMSIISFHLHLTGRSLPIISMPFTRS